MRIYLAGPIFQQSDATCGAWRERFKVSSDFYWLDPMSRDYRGMEDEAFAEIVEKDKADIDSCDVLIAMVNPASAGTSMEILWGWLGHKSVIVIARGRVSPWVRYHATHIVADEASALAVLHGIALEYRKLDAGEM